MDAQAHLISLGWAGPGHALDSKPQYKQKGHRGLAYNPALDPLKVGNTGNGLVKPLSISRRKDRFGIGKKAHEPASGTEWWLKGFESALGNIGKSESERSGTSTPILPAMGGKHGGLYGFFVKGQLLEGTISKESPIQGCSSSSSSSPRHGKKRKSDSLEGKGEDSSTETDTKKRLKPNNSCGIQISSVRRQPETAIEFEAVGAFMRLRDKEEKRRIRQEKAGDAEQFAQIGHFFAESEKVDSKYHKKKEKKKKQRPEAALDHCGADEVAMGEEDRVETKEERRARRRKRKEQKELLMKHAGAELKKDVDGGSFSRDESENWTLKLARKAERKRQKVERENMKVRVQ